IAVPADGFGTPAFDQVGDVFVHAFAGGKLQFLQFAAGRVGGAYQYEDVLVGGGGRIGFFKIVGESSVAAGVRRIEAMTGETCENAIYVLEDTLRDLKAMFNNAKDLKAVLTRFVEENDAMKREVEKFRTQAVDRAAKTLAERVEMVDGVHVIKAVLPVDPASAKDIVFKVRQSLPEKLVCILGSVYEDRPQLSIMLSDDMVKEHGLNAGKIIREAAKLIKGGGGGQPHYAQAGGKDADGVSAAVDKVMELINL
ncbi:MAG: DHHA1 domain-containing protein, partial [Segatella oris]